MPLPDKKPYVHVALKLHETEGHLQDRFEVRVSTFIESDDNTGRRSITGKMTGAAAMEAAKSLARAERDKIEHHK